MIQISRIFLFCFGILVMIGGFSAFWSPDMITAAFHLEPSSIVGTAEIRGLYGGGFFSFGLTTIIGLRSRTLGPGLLTAMAIFMWSVAIARAGSLVIDHEVAFTLPALIAEIILGLAFWIARKHWQ
jgi:Domain of unknown function (DUF4345)